MFLIMQGLSVNTNIKLLWEIKKEAERIGIRTCWQDPFYHRINPDEKRPEEKTTPPGNKIYLPDPPIPRITPFDFASVSISLDEQISFKLSIYYWKVLDGKIDADEIHEVFDRHAGEWSAAM